MKLERINKADLPEAIELLKSWRLPYSDIEASNVLLFGFKQDEDWVGIGGLEIFGQDALIRSVAVAKGKTNQGIGKKISCELEAIAKSIEIKTIYLLTTTAKVFFNRLKYSVIDRKNVPSSIKNTNEFSELCPESAICMVKKI